MSALFAPGQRWEVGGSAPSPCSVSSVFSMTAFALAPPRVLTLKGVEMSAQAWLLDARFPTWVRTVLP